MFRPTSTPADALAAFDMSHVAPRVAAATQPGSAAERRTRSRAAVEARVRPNRKLPISIRPLELVDVVRAITIALSNFGNEIHLIVLSYLWYFWRRAGFFDFGAMWSKRRITVAPARSGSVSPTTFYYISSFIHGRDVAWIDLGGMNGSAASVALAAIRQWPCKHRLLIVRVHRSIAQRFLDAGFKVAGMVPDGNERYCYMHAARKDIASDEVAKLEMSFGRRRKLAASCEFNVVEREGKVVGLTGIYDVDFWRGVTWGAWGAMDPACARRDAVFETLRLTEERARAEGANWFCLETSDCDKYRHARKIYELYGMELLLAVPNFYAAEGASKAETYMVFGKSLATPPLAVTGTPTRRFDVVG